MGSERVGEQRVRLLGQLGVGAPAEDDNVADHGRGGVAWGGRKGGQARNARGCGAGGADGADGAEARVRGERVEVECRGKSGPEKRRRAGRRSGRWEQWFRNWAAACWIMERSQGRRGKFSIPTPAWPWLPSAALLFLPAPLAWLHF
jgi:hypothetical protein